MPALCGMASAVSWALARAVPRHSPQGRAFGSMGYFVAIRHRRRLQFGHLVSHVFTFTRGVLLEACGDTTHRKTYIPAGLDRQPRGDHSRSCLGEAGASAIACAANTVGSGRSHRRPRGQHEQPRRRKNRICAVLSPSCPTRLSPLCSASLQTFDAAGTKVLAARALVLLLKQGGQGATGQQC